MKLKTILLGDSGMGKSTLLSVIRDIGTVIPTIGVDCMIHNNLQIWDTSGDKRFRPVIEAFYSKMDLAVFMYRDMESLASVEEFREAIDKKDLKRVLIYNGTDEKIHKQGELYAEMYNMSFFYGEVKKPRTAKNIMKNLEEFGGVKKQQWRYCWFY
jgi:GTPase SAR1 family protein